MTTLFRKGEDADLHTQGNCQSRANVHFEATYSVIINIRQNDDKFFSAVSSDNIIRPYVALSKSVRQRFLDRCRPSYARMYRCNS